MLPVLGIPPEGEPACKLPNLILPVASPLVPLPIARVAAEEREIPVSRAATALKAEAVQPILVACDNLKDCGLPVELAKSKANEVLPDVISANAKKPRPGELPEPKLWICCSCPPVDVF